MIRKFIIWYLTRHNAKFEQDDKVVRVFSKQFYDSNFFVSANRKRITKRVEHDNSTLTLYVGERVKHKDGDLPYELTTPQVREIIEKLALYEELDGAQR